MVNGISAHIPLLVNQSKLRNCNIPLLVFNKYIFIYDIINKRSLYKARFQEDKSRLISSASAPSVNNVVFVLFIYCCHGAVFSEWPDRALSMDFAFYCNLSTLFE